MEKAQAGDRAAIDLTLRMYGDAVPDQLEIEVADASKGVTSTAADEIILARLKEELRAQEDAGDSA